MGEALQPFRDQVVIATKFGFPGGEVAKGVDSRPDNIRAVTEASRWREPEQEILPLLGELGIGFVPFSPLGKDFLTGAINENTKFDPNDFRNIVPRFSEGQKPGV